MIHDVSNLLKDVKALGKTAKTKKERIHKNLQIAFVSLGIVGVTLSILISFYRLKHLKK